MLRSESRRGLNSLKLSFIILHTTTSTIKSNTTNAFEDRLSRKRAPFSPFVWFIGPRPSLSWGESGRLEQVQTLLPLDVACIWNMFEACQGLECQTTTCFVLSVLISQNFGRDGSGNQHEYNCILWLLLIYWKHRSSWSPTLSWLCLTFFNALVGIVDCGFSVSKQMSLMHEQVMSTFLKWFFTLFYTHLNREKSQIKPFVFV